MNKIINSCILACAVTSLPAALWAQNPGSAFQYVFTNGGPAGGIVTLDKVARLGGKVVTGKPVTATEERHSLQILGDGTRIESKTADKFYRDDQGRTRTEREDGTIMIDDPVTGAGAEIAPNGRVSRRIVSKVSTANGITYASSGDAFILADKMKLEAEVSAKEMTAKKLAAAQLSGDKATIDTQIAIGSYTVRSDTAGPNSKIVTSSENRKEENLGLQVTNGISSEGTRLTTTIAAGQIGNDRPISVVSERWYSPELQMLIKSTNKDPRFGDTTYELTNIVQGAPDPTLFLIPAAKLGEPGPPRLP